MSWSDHRVSDARKQVVFAPSGTGQTVKPEQGCCHSGACCARADTGRKPCFPELGAGSASPLAQQPTRRWDHLAAAQLRHVLLEMLLACPRPLGLHRAATRQRLFSCQSEHMPSVSGFPRLRARRCQAVGNGRGAAPCSHSDHRRRGYFRADGGGCRQRS